MKTKINSQLLLASKNAATGDILYTFVLTFPRIILAEVNTHRMATRNTSSSRAIPSKKQRDKVLHDPFLPTNIGSNRKGMQAGAELTGWKRWAAEKAWLWPRYACLAGAWVQEKLGVHKQIANRLVEPWTWTQQLFSATELDNFFLLRDHHMAEPHFQELARQMHGQAEAAKDILNNEVLWLSCFSRVEMGDARGESYFQILHPGEWHLPFITYADEASHSQEELIKISAARCARVSYLLPENKHMSTWERDERLYNDLAVRPEGSTDPRHLSPMEHPAMAATSSEFYGNFKGFVQHRKFIPNENGVLVQ